MFMFALIDFELAEVQCHANTRSSFEVEELFPSRPLMTETHL
jgi:hypothetical protein